MTDEQVARPSRRRVLTAGGAACAGLLPGCTGGDSTPAETTPTSNGGATGASHSVTMEPVGTVEFDAVPDAIAPFTADYADMLVALGHADAVETVWYRKRYKTTHYDDLDGVGIDLDSLTELWSDGIPKERFYDVDADLHLIDPHAPTAWFQAWDQGDLEEIRTNVAPFLGNLIFRRTDDWHDYRYYTLYEAFEKVAEIVQESERYETIRSIHDDLVADVQSRLPAPDERPNAALVFAGEQPDEFYPYRLSGNGANKEHFHTLGLSDAFAGTGVEGLSTSETGAVDYETMLEIDPDSLLLRYHGSGKTREEFEESVVSHMRDHPVGSQLSAVQDGLVFQGGPIYCGPLHNLFMLERYAQAYFPEVFGGGDLFDRERLAAVVRGED